MAGRTRNRGPPLAEPRIIVDAFPRHLRGHASTPYDAKGLLKAAIRDDNPVMFIEHKMLYKEKGYVPEEEYVIPFGVADIKRPGKDVTLVTYSRMVYRSLEAAEALAKDGLDVEVIDLRTLKPLDINTIVASVKRPAVWSVSVKPMRIPLYQRSHDAGQRTGF